MCWEAAGACCPQRQTEHCRHWCRRKRTGQPESHELSENIVALCDVDWKYAKECFDDYPNAKRYWDWREMFEEMGDDIDAVMIATSDHTHAAIAATAIKAGKHVYCQKPLTHSVYESRLLTRLAREYKVATQMGNQGNSAPEARTVEEWIWAGEIGEVNRSSCMDQPSHLATGTGKAQGDTNSSGYDELGPVYRSCPHATLP